jgi:RNA polymerase sigma-70 factor (ECF subfamily)
MTAPTDFSQRVRECTDRLASEGVDALGALFDLTSRRLVRFAVAVTANQHDAEDAVQAALVRLATRPQLLGDVACPWAYLLRMVRNEALATARRNQRWTTAINLTDLVTRRRVDELEQEETHRAVWAALRTLPPEQAEVVVLKIWEALTFGQIAGILGESPNTAASRYHYAMTKLTTRLARQAPEARV